MNELFRKFQMMLTLIFGTFPLSVLLFAYTGHPHLNFLWIYSATYLLLSMIGLLISKKVRLIYGVFVSVAALISVILFSLETSLFPSLTAAFLYILLFLWSISMASWPSNLELPVIIRFLCFGLHLVAQYAVLADKIESNPVLATQEFVLHLAFVGYLFLILLSMNRDSMNKASTEFRRVPQAMRQKNVIMTLVLFAVACAASFIPYIYDWMKDFIAWLIGMILLLMSMRPSDAPINPTTAAPTETVAETLPVSDMPIKELSPIFEFIILAFGATVFICVTIFLIYFVIKKMIALAGKLWGVLERYAAAAGEDYEDEITDTRKETVGERINKKRHFERLKEEMQKPSNPGESIRYRYRRLLRKHPEWTADSTARENIPVELATLYEHARYSDCIVSEKEAEQFQTGSKKL